MEAEKNFRKLPPPLTWVDPSINMPYLESVSCFVFGQYLASILVMCSLLEHCLRTAILESLRPRGNFSKSFLNKYDSISALLREIKKNKLLSKFNTTLDVDWWEKVACLLRNKSMHLIIPEILEKFNTEEHLGRFSNSEFAPEKETSWGFLLHVTEKISPNFISKSNKEMELIIQIISWQPMTSCWESQKRLYDKFFSFDWDIECAIDSLKKIKAFDHINK